MRRHAWRTMQRESRQRLRSAARQQAKEALPQQRLGSQGRMRPRANRLQRRRESEQAAMDFAAGLAQRTCTMLSNSDRAALVTQLSRGWGAIECCSLRPHNSLLTYCAAPTPAVGEC